ncbi:MAG TPA: hypothetical protein VL981_13145 [Candidatus Methylacidiphilales bacterium]|nr:hypothetical protein [Candidatus Methylacidiphilales bacterium]
MAVRHAICLIVLGLIPVCSPGLADDLTTKDGKVYQDYKVQKTGSDGITIRYTETVTIPFDNLPDEIQKKYGHDPNALSAEQAAEKARIDAENREAAKVEADLDEQDRRIEGELTRIKIKASSDYASAAKTTITGQVFIAAKDGELADFSGVQINVIPMELMARWLPEKQARVAAEIRLLKPRIDRAKKDEDEALQERSAAVGTDKFSAALDKEAQARDFLDTLIERHDYFTGGEYYADALAPWPVAGATTDLGGKFTIAVPSRGDFVLAASVKSDTGATVKKYFWFVKIHEAGNPGAYANILLDSENEASSGSNDSALKTEVFGRDNG